jgi:hypothetical protein
LFAWLKVAQLNLGGFALGAQFANQNIIYFGGRLIKGDQSAPMVGQLCDSSPVPRRMKR